MWRVKRVTKFKNSFFSVLIYWNDNRIHLNIWESWFGPPPIQALFTELRPIKDLAAALRGSPQPSQYLSNPIKMKTNTEAAMLSNLERVKFSQMLRQQWKWFWRVVCYLQLISIDKVGAHSEVYVHSAGFSLHLLGNIHNFLHCFCCKFLHLIVFALHLLCVASNVHCI